MEILAYEAVLDALLVASISCREDVDCGQYSHTKQCLMYCLLLPHLIEGRVLLVVNTCAPNCA